MSKSTSLASSNINWIPFVPDTFAISWGSAMTVVTPFRSETLEKLLGGSKDDSMCTWPSISPGDMYFPLRSMILSELSYLPIPTIIPSTIATSFSIILRFITSIIFPFFKIKSAFSRFMATEIFFL